MIHLIDHLNDSIIQTLKFIQSFLLRASLLLKTCLGAQNNVHAMTLRRPRYVQMLVGTRYDLERLGCTGDRCFHVMSQTLLCLAEFCADLRQYVGGVEESS